MILNIKERATRIKLGYSIFILLYLSMLVVSLIYSFLPDYLFEIIWTGVCVVLFTIYLLMGYSYVYYNDEDTKLVFRFQHLSPIGAYPKAYEIPKKAFVKFEIKKSLFGLKKSVVLYQNTRDGVAKYPPVSITALKKAEVAALTNALSSLLK